MTLADTGVMSIGIVQDITQAPRSLLRFLTTVHWPQSVCPLDPVLKLFLMLKASLKFTCLLILAGNVWDYKTAQLQYQQKYTIMHWDDLDLTLKYLMHSTTTKSL